MIKIKNLIVLQINILCIISLIGVCILSTKSVRRRFPKKHLDDAVERDIRNTGNKLPVDDGLDPERDCVQAL